MKDKTKGAVTPKESNVDIISQVNTRFTPIIENNIVYSEYTNEKVISELRAKSQCDVSTLFHTYP